MTDKTILKKAIEKAVKNGMSKVKADDIKDIRDRNYYKIIFSHSFAKAFWGEEEIEIRWDDYYEEWDYHLQEMVISKTPIKYLEQFL